MAYSEPMTTHRALRECVIAVGLLAFGLICLPALIFMVGQLILGEYEAGLEGLYTAIGNALIAGNIYAWILVLSPYAAIQLIRFGLWVRRQRGIVN